MQKELRKPTADLLITVQLVHPRFGASSLRALVYPNGMRLLQDGTDVEPMSGLEPLTC